VEGEPSQKVLGGSGGRRSQENIGVGIRCGDLRILWRNKGWIRFVTSSRGKYYKKEEQVYIRRKGGHDGDKESFCHLPWAEPWGGLSGGRAKKNDEME